MEFRLITHNCTLPTTDKPSNLYNKLTTPDIYWRSSLNRNFSNSNLFLISLIHKCPLHNERIPWNLSKQLVLMNVVWLKSRKQRKFPLKTPSNSTVTLYLTFILWKFQWTFSRSFLRIFHAVKSYKRSFARISWEEIPQVQLMGCRVRWKLLFMV